MNEKKENLESNHQEVPQKKKIVFGIGFKLLSVIGLLLFTSVVMILTLASNQFEKKALLDINDYNTKTAAALAGEMEANFAGILKNMSVGGKLILNRSVLDKRIADEMEELLFSKDADLITMGLYQLKGEDYQPFRVILNRDYALENNVSADFPEKIRNLRPINFQKAARMDGMSVHPARTPDGQPLLTILVPLVKNQSGVATHLVVADIRQNKFIRAFQKETDFGAATGKTDPAIFLVGQDGTILAHPNSNTALNETSISDYSIFKQMVQNEFQKKGATRFEVDGHTLLGAYQRVPNVGWVISQQPLDLVLAPMRHVIKVSIWLGLMVLSGAFIIGFFFSKSITHPIHELFKATLKVAQGDFSARVHYKKNDELGVLATSFGEMCSGLEERDRVKSTFSKFQSKAIAEKLLSGEVHLGGEKRKATILFSDVRGFTAMSESLAPEKVVEMLNEYMSVMVSVINQYDGVVDKYIGDAIMAIWGAPVSHENDTQNAVLAALKMREALVELNKKRIARGEPALSFGIGLNTGEVLAGNIGSEAEGAEKMEYTVIGDSVNLASRIESLTKEMGADILISNSTYQEVQKTGLFKTTDCPPVKVKGKSEKLCIHQVVGHYDEQGTLQTYPDPNRKAEENSVEKWYVKLSGEKTDGPYTIETLYSMVQDGDITVNSEVMKKGTQEWMPMNTAPWFDPSECTPLQKVA